MDFFDQGLGYAEYYLAKKQKEQGLEVSVVASDYQSMYGNQKWSAGWGGVDGFEVYHLRSVGFNPNAWAFNPFRLERILEDFSPDVVHCHGLFSLLSQEALLLKTRYHFVVVGDLVTGIGTGLVSEFGQVFLTQVIKHLLKSWLSNRVDALFACNHAIEKWLRDSVRFQGSRIHFVPLGADHILFKPDLNKREETRRLIGVSPEDVVAIYTGKFLPSKRIHDLLVASKPIIEQHNNLKLVLIGDGPSSYTDRLKSLIKKLGIDNNVLVLKTVHRTELPNFYNAADLAVWPGTFSISIIEAMACGLPVIIARSDWTSHYLEYENGYSFQAGDTGDLCSILLRLVEDSELRKSMGARSQKLVEDKLNWDAIAKEYVKIYRECSKNHTQNRDKHIGKSQKGVNKIAAE